jgi:predicted dehydrogenase
MSPIRVRQPGWSDVEWQIRRWLFYTWLSGDFIVEQHVHNLDLINWALQAHPVHCYAMGARQVRTGPEFGNIYDQMSVTYEYPNGVQVTHAGRQMDGIMNRNNIRLQGTKGRSIFDFGNAKITGDNAVHLRRTQRQSIGAAVCRPDRSHTIQPADQRGPAHRRDHHDGHPGPHERVHGPGGQAGNG